MCPVQHAVLPGRLVPEEADDFLDVELGVGAEGPPLSRGRVADGVPADDKQAVAGGGDGKAGVAGGEVVREAEEWPPGLGAPEVEGFEAADVPIVATGGSAGAY